MKKVLITGGAGFIGSNLIHFLNTESEKYEITVIDDESVGKREDIDSNIKEFIRADLSNPDYFNLIEESYDYVIHLAAFTRVVDSISNPEKLFSANVMASYRLLNYCRENNIKNMIIASTGGAIIGETDSLISENSFPNPISPYGASKLAIEAMSQSFNKCYEMNIACLRFSNVYGPRSDRKESVVAKFLKTILARENIVIYGDGNQERDYIFVEDIVNGISLTMNKHAKGVFQLSTGRTTSIIELIETIKVIVEDEYEVRVEYQDQIKGEVYKTRFNNKKAQTELGFKPQKYINQGILETWNWLKQK